MHELANFTEQEQNRVLRRVDWRYLLANPEPETSICFTGGLLREGLRAISGSSVGREDGRDRQYDLAVATNPAPADLRSMLDALRPGGEFYSEWSSPFVGGAAGVRKRLTDIGFTEVACYWAWPNPAYSFPLYWLPLDQPNILAYFFANRPTTSALTVRLGRFLLRMLCALRLTDRLLLPVCAIARKPPADGSAGLRHEINREIIRTTLGDQGVQNASRLSWLLWTPGHRSISKIIAYVFSDTQQHPQLVVKMPRTVESRQALYSEVQNLTELNRNSTAPIKGIPRLLFARESKGILAVGESFIQGAPLYASLTRNNYRELALKATDWLLGLARESAPSARAAWWYRLVEMPTAKFEKSFGEAFTPKEMNDIRDRLHCLPDLPLVCEQRDCSPWNVLVNSQGELAVLDWESAELSGLPGLDLIYFLTYLSFFIEGAMESGKFSQAYRNAEDPETFTGRVQQECFTRYFGELGIDRSVLAPLRLLTWIFHSDREVHRMIEDAGGRQPVATALRSSLFAQLVWEEVATQPRSR